MTKGAKNITNLKMVINPEDLKKIIESGKLTEFVQNSSSLAAEEIRIHLCEELEKQVLSASKAEKAVNTHIMVNIGFPEPDEKYGTRSIYPGFYKRLEDFMGLGTVTHNAATVVIRGMTEYEEPG